MALALYLASASPRRLALLTELGLHPQVIPADVDEGALPGESARALVLRLAAAKAAAVRARLPAGPGVILAADTVVVLGRRVLGKPADAGDARSMLRALRGRSHQVLTAVCLARTDDARATLAVERTRVTFRAFDEATLAAYVAGGEPLDKAGAYGIQGAGGALVAAVEGSWTNVVGLPVERLANWLRRIGIELAQLERAR